MRDDAVGLAKSTVYEILNILKEKKNHFNSKN